MRQSFPTRDGDPRRRSHFETASLQDLPGWTLHVLQTSPGTFLGSSLDVSLDGVQLIYEDFRNVWTNHFGSAPEGTFLFGIPLRMSDEGLFNGARWSQGVCALDSRQELNSVVPPMELISVVIDRQLLFDYVRESEHVDLEHCLTSGTILAQDTWRGSLLAARLLELIFSCFEPDVDLGVPKVRASIRSRVLELLVRPIVDHVAPGVGRSRELSQMQVVSRARQFAQEHISDPLQVLDLCRAVGVSRRTVQASFQAVLGISPLTYVRTMRLNGARKMLLGGKPQDKVRDAVETWGFWHMSRFSDDYRQLFGELPSQTLKRAQSSMRV